MRILHLTPTLGSGGAERLVVELVKQFHPHAEQQVALLYPVENEQALFFKPELDALEIPLTYLDKRPGKLARLPLLWRYAKLLRHFQPHIIHAHQWHPMDIARAYHRLWRRQALVVTPHNIFLTDERIRQEQRFAKAADRIVVVSKGIEAQYRANIPASRDRLLTIPNGIDTNRFETGNRSVARAKLSIDETAILGLVVGRIHPQKNLHVLIEAVNRLVTTQRWRADARIIGVGRVEDRRYADRLAQTLQDKNLTPYIQFVGESKDVLAYYHACDFLILPSDYEGLPLVVLEAGGAGRPAVVSVAANPDEAVLDGQTGWVVPTGDVEALANCLERVVNLPPAERDRMGLAARERVQAQFDIRQTAQQYLTLYRELAEQGKIHAV
jgi:glycosyltransferase involved in cell wall biosynthesis